MLKIIAVLFLTVSFSASAGCGGGGWQKPKEPEKPVTAGKQLEMDAREADWVNGWTNMAISGLWVLGSAALAYGAYIVFRRK